MCEIEELIKDEQLRSKSLVLGDYDVEAMRMEIARWRKKVMEEEANGYLG